METDEVQIWWTVKDDTWGKGLNSPNWLNSSFRLSSSTSSPKFLIYTLVNSLALAPSSASRSFRDLNLPTNLKRNHEKQWSPRETKRGFQGTKGMQVKGWQERLKHESQSNHQESKLRDTQLPAERERGRTVLQGPAPGLLAQTRLLLPHHNAFVKKPDDHVFLNVHFCASM